MINYRNKKVILYLLYIENGPIFITPLHAKSPWGASCVPPEADHHRLIGGHLQQLDIIRSLVRLTSQEHRSKVTKLVSTGIYAIIPHRLRIFLQRRFLHEK